MLPCRIGLYFVLFLLLGLMACRRPPETHRVVVSEPSIRVDPGLRMRANIQRSIFYDNIPSASGLELVGDYFYVIGDDSPYLYRLDRQFNLQNRIALTDTASFASGRVAKAEKLDLEGMTTFRMDDKEYLLMLGSGSSPLRTKAFIAEVPVSPTDRLQIRRYALDNVYEQLQQDSEIINDGLLNIEGVAAGDGKLYMMQRGLGEGRNVLLSYNLEEFIRYLTASPSDTAAAADSLQIPVPQIHYFTLPILGQLQAGFSGAYYFDDKLFFTATIENTADAINDGEVLGSYLGYIPLDALEANGSETLSVPAAVITRPDGATYLGKVESLVVQEKLSGARRYKVVAVSDDDKGNSELLEVLLRGR